MPHSVNQLQRQVHALARIKGWWPDDHDPTVFREDTGGILARLALVHSEISEAVEAVREGHVPIHYGHLGKPEGLAAELADAVIRIMDLCEALDIDLEMAVLHKHNFNEQRPHRHGGKKA